MNNLDNPQADRRERIWKSFGSHFSNIKDIEKFKTVVTAIDKSAMEDYEELARCLMCPQCIENSMDGTWVNSHPLVVRLVPNPIGGEPNALVKTKCWGCGFEEYWPYHGVVSTDPYGNIVPMPNLYKYNNTMTTPPPEGHWPTLLRKNEMEGFFDKGLLEKQVRQHLSSLSEVEEQKQKEQILRGLVDRANKLP